MPKVVAKKYSLGRVSTDDKTDYVKEKIIDIPIVDNTELRKQIIARIEDVALSIILQISSERPPYIAYETSRNYTSIGCPIINNNNLPGCSKNFDESNSLNFEKSHNKKEQTRRSLIDFNSRKGKNKFALMMTVMTTAHRLLITNTIITRRSLYYDLKSGYTAHLVPEQRYVDQAVNNVAELLKCSPWDLNLIATSKGLAAGELTLSLADNRIIDCTVPGGALIPHIISNVISVRARARLVLIVEKDAVFQKLLDDGCTRLLDCILVTGKGYPDVATRMLVKLLAEKMELPVYIIVDADPFGVDIMCTYRFGSAALSRENENLACPSVRWLGIFPSELVGLGVKTVPLTEFDLTRLTALENRPFATEKLLRELNILRRGKAEIEGVSSFSRKFLTTMYLSCKIRGNDYI